MKIIFYLMFNFAVSIFVAIVGWGLEVKSWPAIILGYLLTLISSFLLRTAL